MTIEVFIFVAILYDLVWSKPHIREEISQINHELVIINDHIEKIDSQQVFTSKQFIETITEMNQKDK